MNQYTFDKCTECPFFKKDMSTCTLTQLQTYSDSSCSAPRHITPQMAARVLHVHQKWRRYNGLSKDIKMVSGYLLGKAIDVAIRTLRKYNRQMKLFANNYGDGYNKDRIFIAAHDKEEAVRVYESNKTKHRYPDDGWYQVPHTHTECNEPTIIMED